MRFQILPTPHMRQCIFVAIRILISISTHGTSVGLHDIEIGIIVIAAGAQLPI
jgi:hypothetical protein